MFENPAPAKIIKKKKKKNIMKYQHLRMRRKIIDDYCL